MKHTLPPLPYALNALQPILSSEQLEFHHGKHHKAYVDKLNGLIQGTEFAELPLEQIVLRAGKGPIFNNAAQHWNHTFYWSSMIPSGREKAGGELMNALVRDFGSFDGFQRKLLAAAAGVFGSGWAWLATDEHGDKLEIVTTPNGDNPLTSGRKPLLTIDVWEHAYYIDYRNERPRYLDSIWKILNWDFAERNFLAAGGRAAA